VREAARRTEERIVLGPGAVVDHSAIIGHPSGRTIPSADLIIGPNAIVRSGTVIYVGSSIGRDLATGHNVVIREENRIGDGLQIWNNSVIDYGCRIGDNVKIHCNVYVAQFTVLEDDVFLAPGVTIANDLHPGCPHFRECMRGPTLRRGAKVGVNVTILPQVEIGERSLIGAGAVVTRDIPPHSVAVGNPARVTRSVHELTCVRGITDRPYEFTAFAEQMSLGEGLE
jgi:acetyltransferase-like isoleucine patch superfamily enzyme